MATYIGGYPDTMESVPNLIVLESVRLSDLPYSELLVVYDGKITFSNEFGFGQGTLQAWPLMMISVPPADWLGCWISIYLQFVNQLSAIGGIQAAILC